jgi:hypothetical protein
LVRTGGGDALSLMRGIQAMSDAGADADGGVRGRGVDRGASGDADVLIGDFGAVGDTSRWSVYWCEGTGEVYARRCLSVTGEASRRRPARLLGRVPAVAYLSETLRAIDFSRHDERWKDTLGIDEIERWLRMVAASLNAEAGDWLSTLNGDTTAYYLDHGHTRSSVDFSTAELMARELWDDLDDTAAHAASTLSELIDILHEDGNLARAATVAQRLVELAIGMHLALNEAYRVGHQQLPGPQPP